MLVCETETEGSVNLVKEMLVSASAGVLNALLGKLATLTGEEYAKLKGVQKQVRDDPLVFQVSSDLP